MKKNCELELFRSRIFNNQFLKFVGFEDGPRKMVMHEGEFRERNGYEGWLGVNMCMGMRIGLHRREWVCMDEGLEREMGMRDGWV